MSDYAIILTDASGRILEWSSGAERIVGLDSSDAGRLLQMIFPSDDLNGLSAEIAEAGNKVTQGTSVGICERTAPDFGATVC